MPGETLPFDPYPLRVEAVGDRLLVLIPMNEAVVLGNELERPPGSSEPEQPRTDLKQALQEAKEHALGGDQYSAHPSVTGRLVLLDSTHVPAVVNHYQTMVNAGRGDPDVGDLYLDQLSAWQALLPPSGE